MKTVDKDPGSSQRWISGEIKSAKLDKSKYEKSKDYCKADTTGKSILKHPKPEEGRSTQLKYCFKIHYRLYRLCSSP